MPQDGPVAPRSNTQLRAVGRYLTDRSWRLPLLILVGTFFVFALTARHGGGSWDYYTANYASWHLVHTGSPWIDGVTHPGPRRPIPEASTWIKQAANGHTVIARFPGVIAISLPAYALASPESMTVIPGAMTAAAASALTIMLMFLALRTRMPVRHAVVACLALAFATPVWSISADAVWPHTVTLLGIAGMAWASSTERWWLVGVFGGIALWGRLHAAIIVAVVGVLLGWRRREPRITLVIGADQCRLPRPALCVDPLDVRLLESDRVLRGDTFADRTARGSAVVSQLGNVDLPRPRDPGLDSGPRLVGTGPLPGLARGPRLGEVTADRRPCLHDPPGHADHLHRWRQLLRLPARPRVPRLRDPRVRLHGGPRGPDRAALCRCRSWPSSSARSPSAPSSTVPSCRRSRSGPTTASSSPCVRCWPVGPILVVGGAGLRRAAPGHLLRRRSRAHGDQPAAPATVTSDARDSELPLGAERPAR